MVESAQGRAQTPETEALTGEGNTEGKVQVGEDTGVHIGLVDQDHIVEEKRHLQEDQRRDETKNRNQVVEEESVVQVQVAAVEMNLLLKKIKKLRVI